MIKIRKAKLIDVPIVVRLWKEFMNIHKTIVTKKSPKFKEYLQLKKGADIKFRTFLKKNINSRNGLVLVAELRNKIIGYNLSFIKPNIIVYKIEKLGHISDLYVRKEFQGKGIASKFKNETLKWFKKKKIKTITLMVNNSNLYAHSIYKKWGFKDFHQEMRKKI